MRQFLRRHRAGFETVAATDRRGALGELGLHGIVETAQRLVEAHRQLITETFVEHALADEADLPRGHGHLGLGHGRNQPKLITHQVEGTPAPATVGQFLDQTGGRLAECLVEFATVANAFHGLLAAGCLELPAALAGFAASSPACGQWSVQQDAAGDAGAQPDAQIQCVHPLATRRVPVSLSAGASGA